MSSLKKTLILLSSISFLVAIIYFVDELPRLNDQRDSSLTSQFKLAELEKVGYRDFELILNQKNWQTEFKNSSWDVDQEAITLLWNKLQEIKIERQLQDFAEFRPSGEKISLLIGEEETHYLIGQKLSFDTSFYLKRVKGKQEDIFVVKNYDGNAYLGSNSSIPYLRAKKVFELPQTFFLDRKALVDKVQISNIKVEGSDLATFYLDYKDYTTVPEAYKGIEYGEREFETFKQQLFKLRGRELHFTNKPLDEKEITLTFNFNELEFSLFRKLNQKSGFYMLHPSRKNVVLEFNPQDIAFLYSSAQDFWKKIPLDLSQDKKQDEQFELEFEQRRFGMVIPKAESFQVKLVNEKEGDVKEAAFSQLFRLLGGLEPFQEAFRLSKAPLSNAKELFSLSFRNQLFTFLKRENELIIQREGLNFHYLKSDKPIIGEEMSDYLAL